MTCFQPFNSLSIKFPFNWVISIKRTVDVLRLIGERSIGRQGKTLRVPEAWKLRRTGSLVQKWWPLFFRRVSSRSQSYADAPERGYSSRYPSCGRESSAFSVQNFRLGRPPANEKQTTQRKNPNGKKESTERYHVGVDARRKATRKIGSSRPARCTRAGYICLS